MTTCTQENKGVHKERKPLLWLPYLLVIAVFAIYTLRVDVFFGDEYFRSVNWNGQSLLQFVFLDRYQSFSGRWLLDLFLCLIGDVVWIWRVLNIFFSAVIVLALDHLLSLKTFWEKMMLAILLLLYPFESMAGAGWMSTTAVYWWVLAALLVSFIPVKMSLGGKKPAVWQWIVYLAATCYACNQEQAAILFLVVAAAVIVTKRLRDGKWSVMPFQIVQIIVAAAMLLSVIAGPANGLRQEQEIAAHFANFGSFGLFEKLYLGVTHTFDMFFALPGMLMFPLAVLILFAAWRKRGKADGPVFLAAVPLLYTILYSYLIVLFPQLVQWFYSHYNAETFDFTNMTTWFPVFFTILWIIAMLKTLWDAGGGGWKDFCLPAAIFLGGGMTTVAMGFSPTVYASGTRTDLFLWFALIYLACLLMAKRREDPGTESFEKIFAFVGGFCAIVEVAMKL